MAQVEVKNLSKDYRRKTASKSFLKDLFLPGYETVSAVDDINFELEAGEAVGYIGPNGSGKSTTIKMMTGILHPTGGSLNVLGREPAKNRIRNNREIGVVFGQRSSLWWDVPVIESYRLLSVLYRIPKKKFEQNLEMLTEAIGLQDLLNIPERQLSLGQKMRCNVAAAFLHDPQIVFLDEPTVGIDVSAKADIRSLIRKINEEKGTTFIITSHDFQDIEALCRRLIILNKGRIVIDTSAEEMRKKFGSKKSLKVTIHGEYQGSLDFINSDSINNEGVEYLTSEGNTLQLGFDSNKCAAHELIYQVANAVGIVDVSIQEPSIESIIEEILKMDGKGIQGESQ